MKVHPKRLSWITKRLVWAFIAVVVVLVIFAGMRIRNNMKIKSLKISLIRNELNYQFVRVDDVRDIIRTKFGYYMEEQQIGTVNTAEIESVLEQDMFIREAQVYIDAQGNANITIEQRQPVVRVCDVQDKTGGYYLDIEGKQILTSPHYTARVPVITGDVGIFTSNFLEVETNRLNRVFELVKYILKDDFLKVQIEQINIEHSGDVVLAPKVGDHVIYFGNPTADIEDKFKRLKAFYKEGLSREGWEKYQSINIAYKNQVVCKKR